MERIVTAALEPDAIASEIERAAGIHSSQLFRWRWLFCGRTPAREAFKPFMIASKPTAAPLVLPERAGMIEIKYAGGGRMRKTLCN